MTTTEKPPETPLARALRRIAKGKRLSSLDCPVLDDSADHIDELEAEALRLRARLEQLLEAMDAAMVMFQSQETKHWADELRDALRETSEP